MLDAIFEKSSQSMAGYVEDERILKTLKALTNISEYLATIPGRKNLIWV